jgi:hypothetical protein
MGANQFVQDTGQRRALREISKPALLAAGTWLREGENAVLCFNLPQKGSNIARGPA